MAAGTFMPLSGPPSRFHPMSPMLANPFDSVADLATFSTANDRPDARPEASAYSAILLRKLPRNTTPDALRSMLVFAKDFVSADFVNHSAAEDAVFLSAIARFRSPGAAQEARAMLDGKPNSAGEAHMIVEVLHLSPGGSLLPRRNTLDRSSDSSATSSSSQGRQSSRYNGTFQALERVSPPRNNSIISSNTEQPLPPPDSASAYQTLFSPQSPIGQPLERQRVSGKSVIGQDGVDDETGKLLNDPVAFAKSDMSRRNNSSSHLPTRFGSLSISSGSGPSNGNGSTMPLASPRSGMLQSPSTFTPGGMSHVGPNAMYQLSNQHHLRHNYPPVNPADQNPPCNTLYVGNLPIDTSEDELKAMFSKQRGYKRLCFRTKQNGPMCFVEFEDVSFATKALNELYGHPLHNSIKGGIRLSFSKNPLGVRTGQSGSGAGPGSGLTSPMSPAGSIAGMNAYFAAPPYPTTTGPPPGLSPPPGLGNSNGSVNVNGTSSTTVNGHAPPSMNTMNTMYSNGPMSPGAGLGVKSPSMASATAWPPSAQQFPDYMLGR